MHCLPIDEPRPRRELSSDMSNSHSPSTAIAVFAGRRVARDRVGLLGIGLCGLACASEQWLGLVIGVAVILAGLPTTSLAAFILGQLGLIAAGPTAQLAFWGAQLGVLLVVTEPLRDLPLVDRGWQVGTTTVVGAMLVVLAATARGLRSDGIWVAVAVIAGLVAGSICVAHRYTQLRLGIVDATPPTD